MDKGDQTTGSQNQAGRRTWRGTTRTVVVAAVLVLLGMAVFLLGRGELVESAAEETPLTLAAAEPTARATEGPDIAPIDACPLLSRFEVFEALDVPYDDQAIYDVSGFGPSRDAGRGQLVTESCKWVYYPDAEAWENYEEDYAVIVTPGDPVDFEEGATSPWELVQGSGAPVTGVGDLAVWFPGADAGLLSVIEETPHGLAFVRTGVAQPNFNDGARLEIAKSLAEKAIDRLVWGPVTPVEVALCDLISDEEAEMVLAPYREGRPAARELLTFESEPVDLTKPGDSSCRKLILAEVYVELAQGATTGFEAGSRLGGVAGEPIAGIGDEAIWFFGVPVDDFAGRRETGVLGVRVDQAHFRLVLSLPDTPEMEQVDIAQHLALKVLGRLPGTIPVLTFEPETPDISNLTFADNVLARVEAGEWSLGEGLVDTLKLFVGEVEATEVLVHEDLVDYSGTGIVSMAYEYLDTGPDAAVKTEIRRLLSVLDFRESDVSAEAGPITVSLGGDLIAFGALAQEEEPQSEGEVPECASGDPSLPGYIPISAHEDPDHGAWKYVIYYPDPGARGGWTDKHLGWVTVATAEAVDTYGSFEMPCIHLLFTQHGGSYTYVLDTDFSGVCGIAINKPMQSRAEGPFKQQLAADIAHCGIPHYWPNQFELGRYKNRLWWNHALARYMSNIVYPDVNLEWALMGPLSYLEMRDPLVYRKEPNWIFFQEIYNETGAEGIDELVKTLPASNNEFLHEQTLAGEPEADEFMHQFYRRLTDASIDDQGGGPVPYEPQSYPVPISDRMVLLSDPEPLGVDRYHLMVAEGQYACFESEKEGDVKSSLRKGSPGRGGAGGSWYELPDEDVISGEYVLLVTAIEQGEELIFQVKKVVDDPEDCEEEEPSPPPPAPECPLECLSTSNFFRYLEQLADWLGRSLDDSSN